MCQREGHVTIDKMFKKNTHKLKQAREKWNALGSDLHTGISSARNPICRRIKRNKNAKKTTSNQSKTIEHMTDKK